jgi:hypothetical protein
MRLIKLALISFVILFILVTVISLFIPSGIRISKATNIAAEDTIVYNSINNLSNWRNWHPALKNLSANEIQKLNDATIRVKGTTISIVQKKDNELITEMVTDEGRPVFSGFKIIRHPADSSTLQWYMDFKLRWYPWEKFRSLFYENIYGLQMEQGLTNLKELSRS